MSRRSPHRLARLVGARVRELREDRSWRQSDLVAHCEEAITDSTLSFVENGQRALSLETLAVIAKALEVHPAVLLLDPASPSEEVALVALLNIPDR